MSRGIFAAAALSLLAVASGNAAAQTARPVTTMHSLPPQSGAVPATISRVDPLRALQDQVAELKAQVAALKQANDALAAKLQTVDGGLGQVVTQNVTQAKQINDLSQQISGVSTKLANHRHAYKHSRVDFRSESFVTESGGVTSSDKKALGTVITATADDKYMTDPAE